jgi:hypothetical protein
MTRKGGFSVDASAVAKRCDKLLAAYGPAGLRDIGSEVESVLLKDSKQSFSARQDPNTGRSWRRPRFPQAHNLLDRTGTLKSLTTARKKVGDVRVWVKGLVPDGTKLISYNRRSTTRRTVGRSIGDYVGIALLHHYGRRDRRLPARRSVGISPAGRRRIQQIAKSHSDRARNS